MMMSGIGAHAPFGVGAAEDRAVMADLARVMYLQYCDVKGFTPNPAPYVPAWAIDYASTAVSWLGWDEAAESALRKVSA